ncbi:hypothetical protein Tco_1169635, partial [Tanacetum coccineum]
MIAKAIQQERENLRSEISSQVNDVIANHIPSHVDSSVRHYMSGHIMHVATTPCIPPAVRLRDQDDPHDDAHPEGEEERRISRRGGGGKENSAKRQKIYEHGTFEIGGSSYGQDYEGEPGPSISGNQEQSNEFDYWTSSYAIDDDMLPNEKVSQELMDEISQNVDEAKLRKVVDEMLRQQCTSGDEHQCYIDQMQNFLKSDIVWESRKEII